MSGLNSVGPGLAPSDHFGFSPLVQVFAKLAVMGGSSRQVWLATEAMQSREVLRIVLAEVVRFCNWLASRRNSLLEKHRLSGCQRRINDCML